jgi:hypothetical protein
MIANFFHPSVGPVFGSETRYPGWVKIRILDKHPGSATLLKGFCHKKRFSSFQTYAAEPLSWIYNCFGSGFAYPSLDRNTRLCHVSYPFRILFTGTVPKKVVIS